jgi:hypothetical protein
MSTVFGSNHTRDQAIPAVAFVRACHEPQTCTKRG